VNGVVVEERVQRDPGDDSRQAGFVGIALAVGVLFDILPLLVATDGAIKAFGHDPRRLRPNIVVAGVEGLAERRWQWRQLAAGEAVIALADLRARCIMTTWDPDTLEQDVDVFRHIRSRFGGTLALNAWAAHAGLVALGDEVRIVDRQIEQALPEPGRFA
jgi:hypothetical protein